MLKKITKVLINHTVNFSEENLICIKSQFTNCKIDFYFVCPESLKNSHELNQFQKTIESWNPKQNFIILFLKDYYFKTINNYSELLCSEYFYSHFNSKYEYIFVLQPDVWLSDNSMIPYLVEECDKKKIDFIGAPLFFIHDHTSVLNAFFKWNKTKRFLFRIANKFTKKGIFPKNILLNYFFVGVNGGSSLRRVEAFLAVSKEMSLVRIIEYWSNYSSSSNLQMLNGYFNEDIFWSLVIGKKMKRINVAKNSVCAKYFWELGDKEILSTFTVPHKSPLSIHKFYNSYYPNKISE
jgi:hypothetical protein